MKRILSALAAVALASATMPALAIPAPAPLPPSLHETWTVPVSTKHRRHRHVTPQPVPYQPGDADEADGPDNENGGYDVNRYGYGNFTGGPSGGFAGYPAGSAGAQIYRQQEEWKCEAVPETC